MRPVKKVPVKLERDPIVEAVFEIRFESKSSSASEILPGLMYDKFKASFKPPERLPIADLPKQFQELDATLRYQPRLRLDREPFSIFIGDRSVLVSCAKPYVGWPSFKPMIIDAMNALRQTDLVSKVERCSIKYVNLIEAKSLGEQFTKLEFTAKLGGYDLTEWLTNVRTEIKEDDVITLIEVRSNAIITTPNKQVASGLFVAVDAIHPSPTEFWENLAQFVEKVHTKEKQVFFDLLTEDAKTSLGAQY